MSPLPLTEAFRAHASKARSTTAHGLTPSTMARCSASSASGPSLPDTGPARRGAVASGNSGQNGGSSSGARLRKSTTLSGTGCPEGPEVPA